jgi:hypothetical protein
MEMLLWFTIRLVLHARQLPGGGLRAAACAFCALQETCTAAAAAAAAAVAAAAAPVIETAAKSESHNHHSHVACQTIIQCKTLKPVCL